MSILGFKKLTTQNWLEPDEASLILLSTTTSGEIHPDPATRWINFVLAPVMEEAVPGPVISLFEVARATISYGFLFYPLFTLGLEQLSRVGEAAIIHKCKIENSPISKRKFDRGINWLAKNSFLSMDEKRIWHSMRGARNYASHKDHQSIIPPGMVLGILRQYVGRINTLYAR